MSSYSIFNNLGKSGIKLCRILLIVTYHMITVVVYVSFLETLIGLEKQHGLIMVLHTVFQCLCISKKTYCSVSYKEETISKEYSNTRVPC